MRRLVFKNIDFQEPKKVEEAVARLEDIDSLEVGGVAYNVNVFVDDVFKDFTLSPIDPADSRMSWGFSITSKDHTSGILNGPMAVAEDVHSVLATALARGKK